jgi:hypothetical protein
VVAGEGSREGILALHDPRELTSEAFRHAFATLGYSHCQGEEPEPGYEKVALFADADGNPTHAARQLSTGQWTSKLGKAEDIEHRLHDLEGEVYGRVVWIVKRECPSAPDKGTGTTSPTPV